MYKKWMVALIVFSLLQGCKQSSEATLMELSTYSDTTAIRAVIEIPAGTSHQYKYDKGTGEFLLDQKGGKEGIVNFLPYPGNYGFIPSTYMDPALGGDGDALDVLVLSESQPQGTVMEVLPIALFRMEDTGELDAKVIAIPKDPALQTFKVHDFATFSKEFVKAKLIIEYWLTSYKGEEVAGRIHWQDKRSAYREINRWLVNQKKTSQSSDN